MKKYVLKQVVPKNNSEELIDLIVKIEEMLINQDNYWSLAYIPSAKAYSIYISTEEFKDYE